MRGIPAATTTMPRHRAQLIPGSSGDPFPQVTECLHGAGAMCDVRERAGRSASRIACGPKLVPRLICRRLRKVCHGLDQPVALRPASMPWRPQRVGRPGSRLRSPPTTATRRHFAHWQLPRREGSVYHRTDRFRPYLLVVVLTFICISCVDVVLSKKVNQSRYQNVESLCFSLSR